MDLGADLRVATTMFTWTCSPWFGTMRSAGLLYISSSFGRVIVYLLSLCSWAFVLTWPLKLTKRKGSSAQSICLGGFDKDLRDLDNLKRHDWSAWSCQFASLSLLQSWLQFFFFELEKRSWRGELESFRKKRAIDTWGKIPSRAKREPTCRHSSTSSWLLFSAD